MARYEVGLDGGEVLIIEHPAADLAALLGIFTENEFLLLSEIRVGSMPPVRDVLLSSRHVRIVRPLAEGAQSSTFRAKR